MSRRGPRARLLRVRAEATEFEPLLGALTALGLRCGWLDLEAEPEPPPEVGAAAELGFLRAVAAGGGRTVAVKRLKGPVVVRDLLREHFAGCDLVLVKGTLEVPALEPAGAGRWRITLPEGGARELATGELARRLRRPGWPASDRSAAR